MAKPKFLGSDYIEMARTIAIRKLIHIKRSGLCEVELELRGSRVKQQPMLDADKLFSFNDSIVRPCVCPIRRVGSGKGKTSTSGEDNACFELKIRKLVRTQQTSSPQPIVKNTNEMSECQAYLAWTVEYLQLTSALSVDSHHH